MHLLKHAWSRLARTAWKNRQELVAAGLTTRRDLLKLGLLTGAGALVAKHGLSSRVADAQVLSPPTQEFVEPLPIMPVMRPLPGGAADLTPYPTIAPNNAGGEGRTRSHQAFEKYPAWFPFPPAKVFVQRYREAWSVVSPDLPPQPLWGADGMVPGPTFYARDGEQVLVRRYNDLPANNNGFGIPQIATHLHNAHTPSESDGFPCDYYPDPGRQAIANATFYDHHYPNVCAGFSTQKYWGVGDTNEALATCWYHDHRVEFTAQNVYKGLAGFYLLYNEWDTGDETTGFRLPGVRDQDDFYAPVRYDIPLYLNDKVFDPASGYCFFDLFNTDGIVGDKFLVNGKIQPYLEVEPRRYRFRILNGGASRMYQLFLTDKGANPRIPFWTIANDGNLLPKPKKMNNVALSGAERRDIVIDFAPWTGKTLYFENRLKQEDGRGSDENIGEEGALYRPGRGNFLLQFRVKSAAVEDNSVNFETNPGWQFYAMPPREAPRLTRTLRFERGNGEWQINGKLFPPHCDVVRFRVQQGAPEEWRLVNDSGGWMHPVHIHFEEFQTIRRNGTLVKPGDVEYCRKDVSWLGHNELTRVYIRFRDFEGRYPIHCHNLVHEDHAMMLRFDVDQTGDTKANP
jgi:FtsP/CotA-like multicopper oxidase with cupredoxin domain